MIDPSVQDNLPVVDSVPDALTVSGPPERASFSARKTSISDPGRAALSAVDCRRAVRTALDESIEPLPAEGPILRQILRFVWL